MLGVFNPGTGLQGGIADRLGAALAGRYELERELGPGDSYLIPGTMPHFVRALDAARLVEVFSPPRAEFAND